MVVHKSGNRPALTKVFLLNRAFQNPVRSTIPCVPSQMRGTFTLWRSRICVHVDILTSLYKLGSIATTWHLTPILLEKLSQHGRLSPAFGRVQLHDATEFPHHSTNINLLSLLKLRKGPNPSLTVPLRCYKVIINDVSGVASKFATGVGTFNQTKEANPVISGDTTRIALGKIRYRTVIHDTFAKSVAVRPVASPGVTSQRHSQRLSTIREVRVP